jgi:hypothetical protein
VTFLVTVETGGVSGWALAELMIIPTATSTFCISLVSLILTTTTPVESSITEVTISSISSSS